MRGVRSALTWLGLAATVATLCGCGPAVPADCLAPRSLTDTACDVIDGGNWRFVEGEEPPDVTPYCAASCIDFNGYISIAGKTDLKMVPLLRKMRRIQSLFINADTLENLSGLELVDIDRLYLSGLEPNGRFSSFDGLADGEFQNFSLKELPRLKSLESLMLRRAASLSVERTGIPVLDLTNVEVDSVAVYTNESLRALHLPTRSFDDLYVTTNASLTELTWDSGVSVRGIIDVQGNRSLSTCLIERFAAEAKPDGGVTQNVLITNNGPCP